MVTICTDSLTFNNSTFCPNSVFMCSVWIWEQTAIISLYIINWLVFVTETESVYCEVQPESFTCNSGRIQTSKRFSAARFWCRRKRITLMYFTPHRRRPRSILFCSTEYDFSSTFYAIKPSDLVWTLFTATHSRATGRNLMQSRSVHNHTIQTNQPTRCNSFTSLLLDVLCRSTCFGRLHAHHQELTTALTASGFTVGASW